ncbi:MAG: CPBP family intramembrane glutamic endopeptidase, partial [Bryocella sp.]
MPEQPSNLEPQFQAPGPTLHPSTSIFFGPFGMRAGWSLAIFVPLMAFFGFFLAGMTALAVSGQFKTVAAARAAGHAFVITASPLFVIGQDGFMFVAVLVLCWFFAKAERRRQSVYGLGSNRITDIIPGAVTGVVVLSLLVFTLHAMHLLVFAGRALSGPSILLYGLKWLIAFTLVGFAEEYAFRGYIQYTLMRGLYGLGELISQKHARAIAFWLAAIIWSVAFGAVHGDNSGETVAGLTAVVAFGLTACYILWRTGSLWWAIGLHASWDWAQSFLFGVADSGSVSVGRLFVTHP